MPFPSVMWVVGRQRPVARLRQVLRLQSGPTVLVGHSYGGQIITALGTDDADVLGLVYIAAVGLDQGESLGALLSQGPGTPALEHMLTDEQGFGWLRTTSSTTSRRTWTPRRPGLCGLHSSRWPCPPSVT